MTSSLKYRLSPLLGIACAALTVALVGNAGAVTGGRAQLKSTLYDSLVENTIPVGSVGTVAATCDKGDYAISGAWQLTGGNFVWVLADGVAKDGRGYLVRLLVPNKIAEPGVLAAKVKVKAICSDKGKGVVP